MSNYWSQYWQQGHLTSFGADIKENYDGPLQQAWLDFFKQLTVTDKVLDIGTGNGALIALALTSTQVIDCQFTGIDYAKLNISSPELLNQPNVKFISNTAAEQLPFEQASFNTVISQFALEYTEVKKSIKEIARVLSPAGRFQFICHHQESSIVSPNKTILQAALKIKKKGGLLEIVTKLVKQLAIPGGRQSPLSENLRNKLNKEMSKLNRADEYAFQSTNFPLLIKSVFAKSAHEQRDQIIELFTIELNGLISRLSDLVAVALSEKNHQKLLQYCNNNKLKITNCQLITLDNETLAYQIIGFKI